MTSDNSLRRCLTCDWRYESDSSAESFLDQSAKASSASQNPETSPVCQVCLDMLNLEFLRGIAETLANELKKFDTKSANLAVNLPLCVLVRDTVMELRRESGVRQSLKRTGLKEAVKVLLTAMWGRPLETHADLVFTLNLRHVIDSLDERVLKDSGRKRPKAGLGPSLNCVEEMLEKVKPGQLDQLSHELKLTPLNEPPTFSLKIDRSSLHFAGRYNKYSRELPQSTVNFADGPKDDLSVDVFIGRPLKDAANGSGFRFCASGREDIDVRMLGSGRPFVLSVECPKRIEFDSTELTQLESKINKSTKDIFVRDLRIVPADALKILKEGEDTKKKHYAAVCFSSQFIPDAAFDRLKNLGSFTLQQKTPLRVLQRRSLSVRSKTIHFLQAYRFDDYRFSVYLVTEAGTYVKEFVHGDLGRTQPSLGDLMELDSLDILELDVEKIELDWPPEY